MLLCLGILLSVPNLALYDCMDFGCVTSWYVQDENEIIFYTQDKPVAKIVLQDCSVLFVLEYPFFEDLHV